MRLAILLILIACGPRAVNECPQAWPNPTPNGWCCDPQWSKCLTPQGDIKGAP